VVIHVQALHAPEETERANGAEEQRPCGYRDVSSDTSARASRGPVRRDKDRATPARERGEGSTA